MEKKRKWQLPCILIVAFLTLFNILPTLFYYSAPLNELISEKKAKEISLQIQERVNQLKQDSLDWVHSFLDLHKIKAKSVQFDPESTEWISVSFNSKEDKTRFQSYFSKASSQIAFEPERLFLVEGSSDKELWIQRKIGVHFDPDESLFIPIAKSSPEYKELILDRAETIAREASRFSSKSLDIKGKLRQDGFISFDQGYLKELKIDFEKERFILTFKEDAPTNLLGEELFRISQNTNEGFVREPAGFVAQFHEGLNFSRALVLNIDTLAEKEQKNLLHTLKKRWNPEHPDLKDLFIVDHMEYAKLAPEEKALSIAVFPPLKGKDTLLLGMKGIFQIGKAYDEHPNHPLSGAFQKDLQKLLSLITATGYQRIGEVEGFTSFDLLFENHHFKELLVQATRENFVHKGKNRTPLLELSTYEKRILEENKIDTEIHSALIKKNDQHLSAKVSLDPHEKFLYPKPAKNLFWSNFALSFKKILRGDPQKIIRWGLDLSGGKTVELELLDAKGEIVSSESDLKQGMNELYSRVNKMGLSEVSIRQTGSHISVDFPGSQNLSAKELIKASTMQFHIVNETFSHPYSRLVEPSQTFLQKVWDEASRKGKTDPASLQEIACKHLYSETPSEEAKTLKENGLHFRSKTENKEEGKVYSKIVVLRKDAKDEGHKIHPLMIVFEDIALEGANLSDVHSAYDPSKGNYLSFSILSTSKEGLNPQTRLSSWTEKYSREGILGSPLETMTKGKGWRMAVVLNDSVISAPTLDSALRDSAMISGTFSQEEVRKLTSDLKAGSLTFTPHILSEKNVSPELGLKDRTKGIAASIIALLAVIVTMTAYYRFAGVVASFAVLFNLLILWAVLQNLGATLTLAGIAGIILTIGMAVDANVLVFERIKEEFDVTKNIKSAIKAGYSKAFSAILDSNITTVIAAFILLSFDAGPIKSFAMNLIIGITSSMFTALFVTRVYFTYWAKKKSSKKLTMSRLIEKTNFDFLKWKKVSFGVALSVILFGISLIGFKSNSVMGLDFSGGYSVQMELSPKNELSYADAVTDALLKKGIQRADFQVREMSPKNQVRILLSNHLEEKGQSFYGMQTETNSSLEKLYPFEKNPRALFIVEALKEINLSLTNESLKSLHESWTSVSGQMSSTMRLNAILGCSLAFLSIFIYLAFRFEAKFASAALGCLVHDVLITLGLIGIFHWLKVPVQIDLITIAAIMTTIGYSLNDTIIIFDRIREEMEKSPNRSLFRIANDAMNGTLSRTVITSGTTLVVLIVLLLFGGSSIFGFSLVMTLGVICGTLSSWYIATPMLLYLHDRKKSITTKTQRA